MAKFNKRCSSNKAIGHSLDNFSSFPTNTYIHALHAHQALFLPSQVPFHQLNDAGVLFLGGFGQNRNTKRHSFGLYNDAFSGCLRHVQVGRDESPLKWNEALVVENLLPCP